MMQRRCDRTPAPTNSSSPNPDRRAVARLEEAITKAIGLFDCLLVVVLDGHRGKHAQQRDQRRSQAAAQLQPFPDSRGQSDSERHSQLVSQPIVVGAARATLSV